MRHADERALALVKGFEGLSLTRYLCPAGWWTIGYGHVTTADAPSPITEDEATHLLEADLAKAERVVLRLIRVPLTDGQFGALVSFAFNLGSGALQRSAMRQKINREEHDDVPAEFLRWVWAAGRRLPGLIKRRAAEAVLYQAG